MRLAVVVMMIPARIFPPTGISDREKERVCFFFCFFRGGVPVAASLLSFGFSGPVAPASLRMSSCSHWPNEDSLALPGSSAVVVNDECSQCFRTPVDADSLYICIRCYNGGCLTHAVQHAKVAQHSVAVRLKKTVKPSTEESRPQKVTKLAIGVEGGFSVPKPPEYDVETSFTCMACPDHPQKPITAATKAFVDAIVGHRSMAATSQVDTWVEERVTCSHVVDLEQHSGVHLQPKNLAHCASCDLTENLWLCMTCGALGCGRPIYGGGGGRGHALEHYQQTGHPTSCKVGTITADGADIYCYNCDEMRLDEQLAAHMATFGIAIHEQRKTAQTTEEMELERNLNYEWSKVIEKGDAMQLLWGPGHTGLINLGNSCYMAASVQVLFSLDAFRQRYYEQGRAHIASCTSQQPYNCFSCQMAKLAHGLWSGEYSKRPEGLDDEPQSTVCNDELPAQVVSQPGVSPKMFKRLVAESHAEFRSTRQQDAQEFIQYFLQFVRQQEHRLQGPDPTDALEFVMETRLQCLNCHRVRYRSINTTELSVTLPTDAPAPKSDDDETSIPFKDVIAQFLGSSRVEDFKCPQCSSRTTAETSVRLATFPEILMVHVRRFVHDGWVPRKLTAKIDVPTSPFSLEPLRSHGMQADEQPLPEDAPARFTPNPALVEQLRQMGFTENACGRALQAVNNSGAEEAMEWLFAHVDDPNLNDPVPPPSSAATSASADPGAIANLAAMGFEEQRCAYALQQTSGDVERALDWLFSHEGEPIDDSKGAPPRLPGVKDAPATYALAAVITHLGESTSHGHYVAHVHRPDEHKWIYFNDNKVSDSARPPIKQGYLYFFRRCS